MDVSATNGYKIKVSCTIKAEILTQNLLVLINASDELLMRANNSGLTVAKNIESATPSSLISGQLL